MTADVNQKAPGRKNTYQMACLSSLYQSLINDPVQAGHVCDNVHKMSLTRIKWNKDN